MDCPARSRIQLAVRRLRKNNWSRYRVCSTPGPCGILLCRLPDLGAIEVAALLNVARVCRDDGIGQTQKALRNDSGYFETIEVLRTYLA